MNISFLARFTAEAFVFFCLSVSAFGADKPAVRFAISLGPPQVKNAAVIQPSINALKKEFGKDSVVVFGVEDLEEALKEGKADIFISSSGLSRRMAQHGAKDLVTLVSDRFPNPNKSYGALFVVRKDSAIRKIADMKGKRLASNTVSGFTSYQIAMGELSREGYDPDSFFSSKEFVGYDLRRVVKAVLDGEADVGSISSCFLEDFYKEGSIERQSLRPIGVRDQTPCLISSDPYPNWAISTMPSTNADIARRTTLALLSMPPLEGGLRWGIATDLSATDELFKGLKVGPFEFLKNWVFREYRNWGIAIGACILFLAALALLMSKLVKIRTRQLKASVDHEIELTRVAREASDKLAVMQKALLISQMSSMIAHELRQPLAVIKALAQGGQRYLERGELSEKKSRMVLERINYSAQKASDIVDRVRSYTRGKAAPKTRLDLNAALSKACALFQSTASFKCRLEVSQAQRVFVLGNTLEVELAVRNLLKNAAESLESSRTRSPQIKVCLAKEGKMAVLSVSDNGPEITPDKLELMSLPLQSNKIQGMGLGLSIVKSIAVGHGGTLRLLPNPDGGLTAQFSIPVIDSASGESHGS